MSLDFFVPPEIDEIIARIKTYIKQELKELNPTDQNSFIFSLIVALANLTNDNNKQILLDILPNVFPQYCKSEEALENFAEIKNVNRNPASSSSGKATIQGEVGKVIPLGTVFIANNKEFKTNNSVEITQETSSISSLSVNGSIVTAITSSNHKLATNCNVNISGATNDFFNGDFIITVTGLNSFTYSIDSTQTASESSNLQYVANIAELNLTCTTTGSDTNLNNGDTLNIDTGIEGVNSNAYVQFSGISGGSDIQNFNEWKENVVFRWQNPITYFNKNNIEKTAKSISGVTKVWIYEITPEVGKVTIYFIRGNDSNIIPDSNEINTVAQAIRALRTVNDDPNDIIVKAPTSKTVDFTFSSITPNSPTMKTAIKNSLKQFFEDEVDLSQNISEKNYNNAIGNSYDIETGAKLKDYTLDTPTGDISVSEGELPILGTVTFL